MNSTVQRLASDVTEGSVSLSLVPSAVKAICTWREKVRGILSHID